jgi:hypothetical protein
MCRRFLCLFPGLFSSLYSLTYRSFLRPPNEQYVGCTEYTEYCPWFTPTSGNFFECNDKSTCDIGSEGLSCCNGRGGRAKCGALEPMMCEERWCAGGMDYCCFNYKGCNITNRKCYDYGELISGDVSFRPKMK